MVLGCPNHWRRSVRSWSSDGDGAGRSSECLHKSGSLVVGGGRAWWLVDRRSLLRPLPLSVSVKLVVLQVVLGLEVLATHIARGPLLWLLVHIVDVLTQIAL